MSDLVGNPFNRFSMLWLISLTGTSKTTNQFSGVDMNASDRVICAGIERDEDHDVYLLFW